MGPNARCACARDLVSRRAAGHQLPVRLEMTRPRTAGRVVHGHRTAERHASDLNYRSAVLCASSAQLIPASLPWTGILPWFCTAWKCSTVKG